MSQTKPAYLQGKQDYLQTKMSAGVGLIRRGFHEYPHLMIGGGFFLFSGVVMMYAINRHWKLERHRVQWKRRYTVVREEDFDPKKQIFRPEHKYPLFVW